jgi:ABC-type branched-subunit amino acid transport system substrate-binding protein
MDEVKFYVPVAGDIGATFKATPALAGDALNRVELYGGAFKSELYATGSVPAGSVATFRDTVKSTMCVSVMSDSVHLAVMYYDTVYVIAQALNKTNGDTTAAVLKTALESGKFTTPLGDVYQFSSADHNGFGKENLSLAHITPTSFKDGFWEKADGAP